jgi:membrane-anchored protein YejM (alkaline phosphatase superfamily)
MQPATLISQLGANALSNPKEFTSAQMQSVNDMRNFFNESFSRSAAQNGNTILNENSDKELIQSFLQNTFDTALAGGLNDPWNVGEQFMNDDMFNVSAAERIIQQFKPELLVVNMQGVDICHSNYTQYCNNLRKADYAVSHLWQTIQNTPGMANDTILIVAPEHGRNLQPNTISDNYGQLALDHTSDNTSREIFCMVVGPPDKVQQNQVINDLTGESIDIVPTIAHILGFKDAIPGGMLPGRVLTEALA